VTSRPLKARHSQEQDVYSEKKIMMKNVWGNLKDIIFPRR